MPFIWVHNISHGQTALAHGRNDQMGFLELAAHSLSPCAMRNGRQI
jgi:hypothetical protein